ncbi:hypothetical protein [Fructilactobacillus florum]|uniref:Uncharacterized protein n=1 Tax=Fructilactobacillus florum DSM 22689 = JCM 16035 TaxID=1423745 RepID=A0A0R2CFN5_9LACO|nr:hypothetical protein [Fructilactobacillus florum]KRM90513.1 hypothetical protein FC87_GL001197 [Fructilactobacillus florum DSM 22689 = JCM 16035]
MSDNSTFSNLETTAKAKAIKSFLPFYIQKLRSDELDVMTTFDKRQVMANINRVIFDASNQATNNLYDFVADYCHENLLMLMQELPQAYFENGNPTTDWDAWYTEQTDQLDPNATL